jgi:hypothetical protein
MRGGWFVDKPEIINAALTVLAEQPCRRKAIHLADFALQQLPIATMPEDSYPSATAVHPAPEVVARSVRLV